jgi:hypothetical protein
VKEKRKDERERKDKKEIKKMREREDGGKMERIFIHYDLKIVWRQQTNI